MFSAYKLNKQGDNIQLWHTPFLILNQSVVPCPVLTVASWPAYRFLRRQVRWSGIPISLKIFQFVVIHTVFGIVNKADVFLELSCFFYEPQDVGNLIFGSSAFSKSSLNIWKFTYYWSLAWRILSITLLACVGAQQTWPQLWLAKSPLPQRPRGSAGMCSRHRLTSGTAGQALVLLHTTGGLGFSICKGSDNSSAWQVWKFNEITIKLLL